MILPAFVHVQRRVLKQILQWVVFLALTVWLSGLVLSLYDWPTDESVIESGLMGALLSLIIVFGMGTVIGRAVLRSSERSSQ